MVLYMRFQPAWNISRLQDYINVRGKITNVEDLHSKLSKWGELQGYKRNLESYILETYHPIENREAEVEIYLPIHRN
ncbi:hypothetical protein ACIQYS_05370 [Psychrobacillus sp. NPDC096426]|uniref:hypothetical protein n=1 Tax=Psychrobacillus sp. NPDC096426 TaxID=3364491 RepID=UPI003817809C